jgi:hypothetical protein
VYGDFPPGTICASTKALLTGSDYVSKITSPLTQGAISFNQTKYTEDTSLNNLSITDDQIVDNISNIIYNNSVLPSVLSGQKEERKKEIEGRGFLESFAAAMKTDVLSTDIGGFEEVYEKINLKNLQKDEELDLNSKRVSSIIKSKLDEGDLTALGELKNYLQNIYDNVDSSSQKEISNYYGQVEKYYTDKAKSSYAKENLDNYMQTTSLDQRLKELDSFNANPDSTSIPIKPSNVSSKDVVNQYADYLQFREGDVFYNPEYLNKFKSETGVSSLTSPKIADLSYEYNVNTLKNVYSKQKEVLTDYQLAKDAIEKTENAGIKVSDEAKTVLNNYEKEIS